MDSKKLFPESKMSKRKFVEFLDKKGFYIVLILCILIVGATAVILTTRSMSPSDTGYDIQKIVPDGLGDNSVTDPKQQDNAQSTAQSSSQSPAQSSVSTGESGTQGAAADAVKNDAVPAATKTDTNIPKDTKKENNNKGSTEKNSSNGKKASAQKFVMPVFGEISFEYAKDKLLYSKTLEEWRTHSGIDLAAERGTPVKAVADGVVSEINNDPGFGITVIINHQDGTKTVYANLASDDTVSPNQKVKQGDVIGAVGNSAAFESAEQTHLHFEVLKDNEPVDPTAYLPKAAN